ncbi:MAG: beta galactosidase jelly roll domain-containing protein [Bacteroidetes bacterium]|nr:beta galactosidase jelly roll domain-containing protein [Bacteroidota bacterium]MBS1974849.1 beta galactosidase jelly roll domain-containing protein [Bacteroidota bacterium]
MHKFLFAFFLFISASAIAQDVAIAQGWKFKTGDSSQWALPGFDDKEWAAIKIGEPWESQGYKNYDGFAWYRLHVVIPSSIKEKSFLKERIKFDLGKIDDGDEVYLNGMLIGKNGGRNYDIKQGPYDAQRSYTLSLNDSRILWDKENVIAVRVWDGGGDGGMYEGKYGISVMDVVDYIHIGTNEDFQFNGQQVAKKIALQSTSDKYDFNGKLRITIEDPSTIAVVFKQTIGADFAKNRPFEYTYRANLPSNKSYIASYVFEESRTKKEIIFSEGIPYILTPRPSPKPKINGPDVYGVRANAPFLYKIPATGEKPIAYDAVGLPKGLLLDKQTGAITGSVLAKGNYKVKLVAKNKLGTATKKFTIVFGDLIGLTPALGWNSWNCWGLSVSDEKVKASANQMADKLAGHGWSYINIDDGWQAAKRNENGEIVPNKKFPDMKALCDYVHGLGLKIGIYSSPGPQTCGGYLGSYQHEEQDARTYGAWGIDYLKYDWCSYGNIAPKNPSLDDYKKPYIVMRDALNKVDRDILFSFCQYGMGDVWKWGAEIGGNSWRTTGDINDSWGSLSGIGFSQDGPAPFAQPGHFNDPDMLVVGKVGWGPSLHNTKLSPDEQYTHISLWCLLSAPLLIGCDMSQLDDFTLNLLTNDEVLAVDQDAMGKSARKVFEKNTIQVWAKELEDGNKAIGIFNLGDKAASASINFADLNLPSQLALRDLWRQQNLGTFKNSFTSSVPAHGVVLLKSRLATVKKRE